MMRHSNTYTLSAAAQAGASRTAPRIVGTAFSPGRLILTFLITLLAAGSASASIWYVDNKATGANNGTSWAGAWTSITSASASVKAGDTVYISGGPSGSSQTYSMGSWSPTGGSAASPVTYQIGQDAAHNGTVIFSSTSGGAYWVNSGLANVVISGDAGDGSMHFSITGYGAIGNGANFNNVRIAYVNFGQIASGIDFNPATAIEFDHNYVYMTAAADHFWYARFVASAYDVNKAHDNTIYVPHQNGNAGMGADGFQWNGDGYSIYNNMVIGYNASSYTVGQHQDGWQPTGGGSGTASGGSYSSDAQYIKVYGNTMVNLGNSGFFPGVTYGGYNHMRIYNNIIMLDSTCVSGSPEGISAINNQPGTADYLDVVVANNLVIDLNDALSSEWAIWVGVYDGPGESVNGSGVVANNVTINANNITASATSGGFTTTDNIAFNTASAANNFLKYVFNSGLANDLHLTSGSSLRGAGMNLSQYFTTDKDGGSRPATGNWDIGPYQYGSTSGGGGGTSLYELSAIDVARGNLTSARQGARQGGLAPALEPETWQALRAFDLQQHQATLALLELQTARQLDLSSASIGQQIAQAQRAVSQQS